jgi:hypothetical protein
MINYILKEVLKNEKSGIYSIQLNIEGINFNEALIISNNMFNKNCETVTIIPFRKSKPILSKISSIRKKDLGEFLRDCDKGLINKIDEKLKKQLSKPININNFVKTFSEKYNLNNNLSNKMKDILKYELK